MRIRSLLVPVGFGASALLTVAVLGAPTAVGGGSTIVASGTRFTPVGTTVGQGTSVTWSFQGTHTTTSDKGFWTSGKRSSGAYSEGMPSAGTFYYHCEIHAGMDGWIVVPLKAFGSPESGWTLRWSTSPVDAKRAFDVQFRRQGTTTWRNFRTNTTDATGFFNPSRSARYQLRARTTNTEAGKESGWAPIIIRRTS